MICLDKIFTMFKKCPVQKKFKMKNPYIFFSILTIANILAFLINIFIGVWWNKIFNYKVKTPKNELAYASFTVFLNIIIAIPGYILWQRNIIKFSNENIIISFITLFFMVDFLMYIAHYLSHNIKFLKQIHQKHHEHTQIFNNVSLFHMSFGESLLFGVLLTFVALVFSFNIYSFIIFLVINWLYGVIGHLNTKSSRQNIAIFTTSSYHKNHHILNNKNYGFYTYIWDKLFKTYHEADNEKIT